MLKLEVIFEAKKTIKCNNQFLLLEHDKLFKESRVVGNVTSGSYSPTLKHNIAMAYISTSHSTPGTILHVEVRKKKLPANVVKMPFVPQKYYKS